MDRECSWWNRESELPGDYVLQHEQIHFAIYELESRRLNRQMRELAAKLDARAATPDAAAHQVQTRLAGEIEGRMDAILKRSREFDEDTSLGYRPERQEVWWQRVSEELRATP